LKEHSVNPINLLSECGLPQEAIYTLSPDDEASSILGRVLDGTLSLDLAVGADLLHGISVRSLTRGPMEVSKQLGPRALFPALLSDADESLLDVNLDVGVNLAKTARLEKR
jgi:hypothetical protein